MNRLLPRDRWDQATAALLALLALLTLATFRDFGATWDEESQRKIGLATVAWFESGFQDRSAIELSRPDGLYLHLYGGLFEAVAELAVRASPFEAYETRHLVGALWGLAGILGTLLLARRLAGPRAALAATLLLAATPMWWGHSFANSKDIPFAAPLPWILLALLRLADQLPRPTLPRTLAAGVALGAALGVRPGGLPLLVGIAAGVLGLRAFPVLRAAPAGERLAAALRTGAALLGLVAVAWALMLSTWPWGQLNPLSGPVEASAASGAFRWNGLVRFGAEWIPAADLPRSYAPTWFLLTLPESWIVALGAGAFGLWRWRRGRGIRDGWDARALDLLIVLGVGLAPLAAVVALRPRLYDGVRHLIFVLPPLAAAAGAALSAVSASAHRVGRAALPGAFALALALTATDMVRLHPYQYVYFNRLFAGGVAEGIAAYEGDYWGASLREGMRWIVQNVATGSRPPLRVGTEMPPFLAFTWVERDPALASRVQPGIGRGDDLFLATTRWFEHRRPGRVIHAVERMGATLALVVDLRSPAPVAPRRFQGERRAIDLPLPAAWWATPRIEPGPTRYDYALGTPDGAMEAELSFAEDSAPSPTLEQLRAEVSGRAFPGAELTPLAGGQARGWVAVALRPGMGSAVGAARIGGAVVRFQARGRGAGAEQGLAQLLDLLGRSVEAEPDPRVAP
jgi:hypothetical protein